MFDKERQFPYYMKLSCSFSAKAPVFPALCEKKFNVISKPNALRSDKCLKLQRIVLSLIEESLIMALVYLVNRPTEKQTLLIILTRLGKLESARDTSDKIRVKIVGFLLGDKLLTTDVNQQWNIVSCVNIQEFPGF